MIDLTEKYKYLESCFVDIDFNAGEDTPAKLYNYIRIVRNKINLLIGHINQIKDIKNKLQHTINSKKKIYDIKYDNKESELTKKFNGLKFKYEMKLNSLMLNNSTVRTGRSYDERVMLAKQFMQELVIKYENAKDTFSRKKSLINKSLSSIIKEIDELEDKMVDIKTFISYGQERLDALIKTKEDINSIIKLLEIEIKYLDLGGK